MITGADRIAANGDTANKIGTYSLAVLASHHAIPLYVVAPTTTLDPAHAGRCGDPDRGTRPGRDHHPVRRAQSRLRRHPGRADHGDRHRGQASTAPRTRDRSPASGQPHEGDHSRRGLRDPAPPAHRHVGEGAPARRRPADHRPDRRCDRRGRPRRRDPRRHERAQGRRVRPLGRGPGRDRPRRRHELERRPARRDRRHAASWSSGPASTTTCS